MAAKRKAAKKRAKGGKMPSLGTGIAGKGQKIIRGRKAQMERQICIGSGGRWVNGKCV